MQGLIVTGMTLLFIITRIVMKTRQVLLQKQKNKILQEKLERESRTFENIDKITVDDFMKVIEGKPYFILKDYRYKVIAKTTTTITNMHESGYVYFMMDTTPALIEADMKLVNFLEERIIFVVATRKVDLLPTYVVDNVKSAYMAFIRAYELTQQYFEANNIERTGCYLKDLIQKYYHEQNFNCAETVLRAGNEYYNLGLNEKDMKMVGGFGGGLQCGNTCGALLGATSVLSMKYIDDKAHESEDIQGAVSDYVRKFNMGCYSTLCQDIKPLAFDEENRCQLTVEKACDILEEIIAEYGDVEVLQET